MIIAAYIAAVGADTISTIFARRAGHAEGNVLRFAGRFWLPVRLVAAAVIAIIALRSGVEWTLTVATVLYAVVAAWNVYVIVRYA